MASWIDGYDPNQIAQKIENGRVLPNETGKVEFKGFEHIEYTTLLYSMLKFSDGIPQIEARRIVNQAVFKAGEKGVITKQSLLTEINKLEVWYLNLPYKRFVLASSLSFKTLHTLRRIRINDTIIIFESYLPKHYHLERLKVTREAKYSLLADMPTNYFSVRVCVSAKSSNEAVDMALNTLDLIRGIWNWFYNRRYPIRRTYGGRRDPVNNITLGPLHTLHESDGKLATDGTWWYEPHYCGATKIYDLTSDVDHLYKFLKNVRNKLAKCSYGQSIEDAIVRYTRALDERDWNTAFLKLWSVLEFLTHSINENYKTTIRRASFIFEERSYHSQVLNQLREYRNKSVHAGADNAEIETYMYQLKYYVETLLGFLLGNSHRFASLEESSVFLSLSSDINELETQIKIRRDAQKFFGKKP